MVLVAGVRWAVRCKDAGSANSGAIGATEDAAARRPARPDSPCFIALGTLPKGDGGGRNTGPLRMSLPGERHDCAVRQLGSAVTTGSSTHQPPCGTDVLASEWKRKRILIVFPAAESGSGTADWEYVGAAPR